VENAKENIISGRTSLLNKGKAVENAELTNVISPTLSVLCIPVIIITMPVKNETNIVSTNGAIIATLPTLIGSSSFTAECAMAAVPVPASLANTDLLTPAINPLSTPPPMADLLKIS